MRLGKDVRWRGGFGMAKVIRRCGALVFVWIASVSSACGSPRAGSVAHSEQGPLGFHGAVIPVAVQNDNMQDLTIFVLHDGARTRIGVAGAAQSTNFIFPTQYAANAGTVRLAAVPLIGGRFGWRKSIVSEAISVHYGERVVFSLEPDLARSTIAVYAMTIEEPPDSARLPAADSSTADWARGNALRLRPFRNY